MRAVYSLSSSAEGKWSQDRLTVGLRPCSTGAERPTQTGRDGQKKRKGKAKKID